MTNNRTWEPLLEELTVKTFYTPNNPSEIYTLYIKSDLEGVALNRLTRGIRIIDRMFLYTLPIVVVFLEPKGHHQLGHGMGWGIHKPSIKDSIDILTKRIEPDIAINRLASEIFDVHSEDGSLDLSQFGKFQEEYNLMLFEVNNLSVTSP